MMKHKHEILLTEAEGRERDAGIQLVWFLLFRNLKEMCKEQ